MATPDQVPRTQADAVKRLRSLGAYLVVPGVFILVILGIWAGAADIVGDVRPLIADLFVGLGLVLVLCGVIAIILAAHAEATQQRPEQHQTSSTTRAT